MSDKSILLVDDEQPILKSLGSYLEKNSFHVQPASSGEAALAELHSATLFDLVITDLVMPGMSGLELLQKIRKSHYETGVFILTGHGNMDLVIDALHAGVDDFILKPCDVEQLISKMVLFFDRQDALRKIKIYEKVLPICMYCKRIRDDSGKEPGTGQWVQIEEYLSTKSGTDLSHGCCPECFDYQLINWKLK